MNKELKHRTKLLDLPVLLSDHKSFSTFINPSMLSKTYPLQIHEKYCNIVKMIKIIYIGTYQLFSAYSRSESMMSSLFCRVFNVEMICSKWIWLFTSADESCMGFDHNGCYMELQWSCFVEMVIGYRLLAADLSRSAGLTGSLWHRTKYIFLSFGMAEAWQWICVLTTSLVPECYSQEVAKDHMVCVWWMMVVIELD